MSGLAARLLALHELHLRGLLTDEQFARAKARVIGEDPAPAPPPAPPPPAPPPPAPAPPPKAAGTLNPVVPGVGLALGAASIANGGLGG
jgi:hypothetical protein